MQDRARTIQQQIATCEAQLQDLTFLENCKAIIQNGFANNSPVGTFTPSANPLDTILARVCLLKLLSKAALNNHIKMDDHNWFQEAQEKLHGELNRPAPRLNRAEENAHLFIEGCGILLLIQFFRKIAAETKLNFTLLNLAMLCYVLAAIYQRENIVPITATARMWLFPNAAQADAQQR
ncbi:MAG TPA: hypothetical protein VGV92_03140 [Gammaproteobacteria bacterium]|nr:hypothetical protein [Gammaproteobacteria bacterium]